MSKYWKSTELGPSSLIRCDSCSLVLRVDEAVKVGDSFYHPKCNKKKIMLTNRTYRKYMQVQKWVNYLEEIDPDDLVSRPDIIDKLYETLEPLFKP